MTADRGRLEVNVSSADGQDMAGPLIVLLTQTVRGGGKQFRIESKKGGAASGEVPAGSYQLQAIALGHGVGREFVQIHPDRTQKVSVRLTKHSATPSSTVAQRLKRRFDLDVAKEPLQSLHVPRGSRIRLDYREYPDPGHLRVLHPRTLLELRRWVGPPESVVIGEHPRFGPLPPVKDIKNEAGTLTSDQRARARAVADEVIYGNPRAVPANYAKVVEDRFVHLAVHVPVFFFDDVTIDDGAVLEIGNGSSYFACNSLTIHPTGVLSVVGNVSADVGSITQL